MSKRWKPGCGEHYYFVNSIGGVDSYTWSDDSADEACYAVGNCFRTSAAAEAAAEKVRGLLLSIQDSGETATDSQDRQLPEWCKMGEWVWDIEDSRYVKIISITDMVLLCTKDKCTYYEDLEDMKGNYNQARLRPYNAKEMKALMGKVIEHSGDCMLVTAYSQKRNFIIADSVSQTPKDLLDGGYTIDGKPCGVLEHLDDKGVWIQ